MSYRNPLFAAMDTIVNLLCACVGHTEMFIYFHRKQNLAKFTEFISTEVGSYLVLVQLLQFTLR